MSLALILIIIALGLGFPICRGLPHSRTSVLAILGFVVIGVYLSYREFRRNQQSGRSSTLRLCDFLNKKWGLSTMYTTSNLKYSGEKASSI